MTATTLPDMAASDAVIDASRERNPDRARRLTAEADPYARGDVRLPCPRKCRVRHLLRSNKRRKTALRSADVTPPSGPPCRVMVLGGERD
jgi:hypothetical protein